MQINKSPKCVSLVLMNTNARHYVDNHQCPQTAPVYPTILYTDCHCANTDISLNMISCALALKKE